jgi:hypothetical protein
VPEVEKVGSETDVTKTLYKGVYVISTKEALVFSGPESFPDTGTLVVKAEGAVSVKTTTDGL